MIEYFLDKLDRFVQLYCEKKKEDRQLADDALRAVVLALNETEIYYARRERGMPRSEDSEMQLSRYWSAASIPLRHIDPIFSQTCDHKSRYWLNPDDWDDKKIVKYKIRLSTVSKKIRELRGIGVAKNLAAKRKNSLT
jgi:hypothetical protein